MGTTPYRVTLEPGNVLYVPRRWWHHVHNNSFSISVNTWVETPHDHQARVEEALVRYRVASLCKTLTKEERDILLNPNEDELADLVFDMIEEEDKHRDVSDASMPDFGDDFFELVPGSFDFFDFDKVNTKVVPVENSKITENHQLKQVNVFTSESVIKEAARTLKNQWKSERS